MAIFQKFVVELDLVGYSTISDHLEQLLNSRGVDQFNEQIRAFINVGVTATAQKWDDVVLQTTGDGAILAFDSADHVHIFAAAVHQSTKEHNSKTTEPRSKRAFRIGAAFGELFVTGHGKERRFAGATISRAVRLESAASPGSILVDTSLFAKLSPELKPAYRTEEIVKGKRDETFVARRCIFYPEVATDYSKWFYDVPRSATVGGASPPSKPPSPPKRIAESGDDDNQKNVRRVVYELMSKLRRGELMDLIWMLEIPTAQQPSELLEAEIIAQKIRKWAEDNPDCGLDRLLREVQFFLSKRDPK